VQQYIDQHRLRCRIIDTNQIPARPSLTTFVDPQHNCKVYPGQQVFGMPCG
jgi:hypothetical protein